jgi:hypothetical protein
VPDDGKVGLRAEVVGDGNRLVQVQDDVPVTAGHEDRLAWMLNQFNLKKIQRVIVQCFTDLDLN